MSDREEGAKKLEPLRISCTSSACPDGLHCFRKTKRLVREGREGRCRYCGADLVDWARVRARNTKDAAYTFSSLRKELIRHHFWHVNIDEKASEKAMLMGRRAIRDWAVNRITKYVAPASYSFDGRQTPWTGNVVFYAQHAVAACCRKCVEEWHGIPLGREMSEEEVRYLVDLVMMYVAERMPTVPEDFQTVPAARPALRATRITPDRKRLRTSRDGVGQGTRR